MREMVAVLDFGSQYSQLIARCVRRLGVYCEILPPGAGSDELVERPPKALILSGGPASVLGTGAPSLDARLVNLGIPVLGICYGMQLLAKSMGGEVRRSDMREYGPAILYVDDAGDLFADCDADLDVWMSHGDRVSALPPGFRVLAHTDDCPIAAVGCSDRKIYGVQFHPEKSGPRGLAMLTNFCRLCNQD